MLEGSFVNGDVELAPAEPSGRALFSEALSKARPNEPILIEVRSPEELNEVKKIVDEMCEKLPEKVAAGLRGAFKVTNSDERISIYMKKDKYEGNDKSLEGISLGNLIGIRIRY